MNTHQPPNDLAALKKESQQRWEANAEFWDERFGEGNSFQKLLVGPAPERLLAVCPGATLLDIACGNGRGFPHPDCHVGFASSQ